MPSKTSLTNKLKQIALLLRLHKPIGTWLLFVPCLLGLILSLKLIPGELGEQQLYQFYKAAFLFLAGAVVMRSAGCVINDLFDSKFDAKVERTKKRPIVSGAVKRSTAVVIFLILLLLGFLVAAQFNKDVILFSAVLVPLLIIYPLAKRFTNFAQVFLGVIFNSGCLLAPLALNQKIDPIFFLLYAALIIWTVIYDTFYAFQDIKFDLKLRLKSTAIKFKNRPKLILSVFSILIFVIFYKIGVYFLAPSLYFFCILITALHQIRAIRDCDFSDPKSCSRGFHSSLLSGIFMIISIFTLLTPSA